MSRSKHMHTTTFLVVLLLVLFALLHYTLAWRLPPLSSSSSFPVRRPAFLLPTTRPPRAPPLSKKLAAAPSSGGDSDEDRVLSMAVKEEERMGPGAPEGYWNDAENIKQELQVFFLVRDEEERRILETKASNPLRSYLGLSDEEQKRIRKRDSLIDRNLYSDLRRHGFDYLVLPIMEQGGFRAFQEMFSTGGDQPPRQEDTGGLVLGAALEAKLGALSERVATTTTNGNGEEEGGMAAAQGPPDPNYMQDDAASLDPSSWKRGKAPAPKKAGPTKPKVNYFALSNPVKLYSAILLLDLALAFGKSTTGALDRGFLRPDILEYLTLAAEGAVVANLLSVPLTFLLLLQAGQPLEKVVPLALKALLGGPVAVVEYRMKGEFGGDAAGKEGEEKEEGVKTEA